MKRIPSGLSVFTWAMLMGSQLPVSGKPAATPEPPSLTEKIKLNARIEQAKADLMALETSLAMYKVANGAFPTTEQGLDALVKKPQKPPIPNHWMQILAKEPKDPWGHSYRYAAPDKDHPDKFTLISDGPDGKPSTTDDIVSQ